MEKAEENTPSVESEAKTPEHASPERSGCSSIFLRVVFVLSAIALAAAVYMVWYSQQSPATISIDEKTFIESAPENNGSPQEVASPDIPDSLPHVPDTQQAEESIRTDAKVIIPADTPEITLAEESPAPPASKIAKENARIKELQETVEKQEQALHMLQQESELLRVYHQLEHAYRQGMEIKPLTSHMLSIVEIHPRVAQLQPQLNILKTLPLSVVPTSEALKQLLNNTIKEAWQSEGKQADSNDNSVGKRTSRWLKQFVMIRKTGKVEGNSPEAIIANAEYALHTGDVARAIVLLEALPEYAREPYRLWLNRAEIHLRAHRAIETIRDIILPTPIDSSNNGQI